MSDRVKIAVYCRATGLIRQVVVCSREDADRQHGVFENHAALDVTEDWPDAHASRHMVDLRTMSLVARRAPVEESRRAAAGRIADGHELGRVALPDLAELTAVAFLSGSVSDRMVLKAAVELHQKHREKHQRLMKRAEEAATNEEAETIVWEQ